MRLVALTLLIGLTRSACGADAQPFSACNQPAPQAVSWVGLPGDLPFLALPTADGCWVFVSLATGDSNAPDSSPGMIAVLRREYGRVVLARTVEVGGNPTGMALTHDGKLLVLADGARVAFLDVDRLTRGSAAAVLGYWSDGDREAGRVYANVSADDAYLFVSDENRAAISVVNLARARASHFKADALVGRIPVGNGPVALTFSPDGSFLFSTSLSMPADAGWPAECRREWLPDAPPVPQGAIFVIDVARAKADPGHAAVARAPAGCTPVRLALSPGGDVAYVTARGGNELLAFDSAKLVADPARALRGRVRTGTNPIGIAVIDEGRRLIISNSSRFGADPDAPQFLTVLDAAKLAAGQPPILGSIPAGSLPREMRVSADGRTLFVVNTLSRQLQVIDLARLDPQR